MQEYRQQYHQHYHNCYNNKNLFEKEVELEEEGEKRYGWREIYVIRCAIKCMLRPLFSVICHFDTWL